MKEKAISNDVGDVSLMLMNPEKILIDRKDK
jgi:hypothetical protein